MTACRSCGAPIRWARTANGKAMPLDPDPSPNGNLALDGETVIVCGKTAAEQRRANGEALYLSHFATCPQAASHRR